MTVEVTHADREAAWRYRPACYLGQHYDPWLAAFYDDAAGIIKAFARHRIEATRASDARIAELEAKVKRLEGALGSVRRLLLPVTMTLAEHECIDEPLPRDAVILSFMGSGASDHVTVGEYEDAMKLSAAALKGETI
jgi:hypothetical protein